MKPNYEKAIPPKYETRKGEKGSKETEDERKPKK
jgi:hypothetical protein